mgnify:CR=1 FL=1
MKKLMELIKREDGVTAPEYALIAALIAGVIIAVVTSLGGAITGTFQSLVDAMP